MLSPNFKRLRFKKELFFKSISQSRNWLIVGRRLGRSGWTLLSVVCCVQAHKMKKKKKRQWFHEANLEEWDTSKYPSFHFIFFFPGMLIFMVPCLLVKCSVPTTWPRTFPPNPTTGREKTAARFNVSDNFSHLASATGSTLVWSKEWPLTCVAGFYSVKVSKSNSTTNYSFCKVI